MLQYDTLYQSLKKVSAEWHAGHVQWCFVWDYMMFFTDGTFVAGTVNSENFLKIHEGFKSKNANLQTGEFVHIGEKLEIGKKTKNLLGTISNDVLILQSQSSLNWDIFTLLTY